ncbi:MAG: phytoene desaturase family protein [Planctomycetota bacterium]|jgi:phytoene dehydrogenase-like protein
MRTSVNIIGAGIAGLSAGCYLQMNGYQTEIYELHNIPGGLCTAWNRKGYTIEGCIHWLVGSSPSDDFYNLWNELIDMETLQFVDHEEFIRVEDNDGRMIRVFTDVDRLEKELLKAAPEDKKLITDFTRAVRKFAKFKMPIDKAPQLFNLLDAAKMIFRLFPYFGAFRKWAGMSGGEFAEKCKNPLLKKTFESMFTTKMIAFFSVFTLVWMNKKCAGYPVGGSLKFARLIEKRYLELGGKINYKSKVKKIVTEKGSARAILLENGQTHNADIIVSAADGHYTIYEMLDAKFLNDKISNYYRNYQTFPSYVQVSLGVKRTFESEPHMLIFPVEKPINIDPDKQYDHIGVRIFNFDRSLSPDGSTLLTMMFPTENYSYWEQLRRDDPQQYKSQKDRIAKEVIEMLDKRLGDIKSNIDMIDVSTPATVTRYTNNWKGSFEGWILTPEIGLKNMEKVLPGLDNFYMAGQWVEPGGGLSAAIMSGRNLTQIICRDDKKKFTAERRSF